ncbi:uncharacterized protein LOC62_05G007686 [Vanrija pseudolonga]|uniref:Uncharacterized protein n=1 Tax=Vanrija pseudolonga TaxID=143232 RepID=A0AAF1BN90_9TREE|nr:hypothetical protein LOC62_05G007686 [Vanrija pseudolonga]
MSSKFFQRLPSTLDGFDNDNMPARYRSGTTRAKNRLRELPSSTKRMLRRVFKGPPGDDEAPLL